MPYNQGLNQQFYLPPPPPPQNKIMIFGGKDHNIYLGCLSCETYENDSIFNENGHYGSCQLFQKDSLFCKGPFDDFGSGGPFHDLSACGPNASNPPVIVDNLGYYYGRFSIDSPFENKDSICNNFGKFYNEDICKIVTLICQ